MNIKLSPENKDEANLEILSLYQKTQLDAKRRSAMQVVYQDHIVNKMMDSRQYKNKLEVPKLMKIVLNVGFKIGNKNDIDYISNSLKLITGQLPKINKAKKSISNFKIRTGDVVGCMVTLRADKMYHFLEKLIFMHLPRIPNFTGFSPKSFDRMGNFSFGIPKHSIFSEIKDYRTDCDFGMDVVVVTSAKNDEDAKLLLKLLGFPFH